MIRCGTCKQEFPTVKLLQRHEIAAGHQPSVVVDGWNFRIVGREIEDSPAPVPPPARMEPFQ